MYVCSGAAGLCKNLLKELRRGEGGRILAFSVNSCMKCRKKNEKQNEKKDEEELVRDFMLS